MTVGGALLLFGKALALGVAFSAGCLCVAIVLGVVLSWKRD